MAGKYTFNNGRLEFSNRVSEVLTEEDYKAQAAFAQASAVNPVQAATIIKNAQGNLMSPGVLASLSNLNVDAQSGVAKSIAQIDADTREARMADQKAVSQKRKQEEFDLCPINNGNNFATRTCCSGSRFQTLVPALYYEKSQ